MLPLIFARRKEVKPRMCQDPSIFLLPLAQQISALRQKLQAGGFEACFVGGCVRDACRGVEAQDIDLATDATPEQMKALLPDFKPLETGVRHGTLTFTCGGRSVEMTTYRTENGYTDHRRPDAVTFSSSLEEDLARRDFTVNAMAWSPEHGLTDPFGGREDLQKRVIRCVGQAKVRFAEDALRMLRALRFSSVLGFSLDADTEQALHDRREDLRFVSAERVLAETERLLCGKEAGRVILKYTDVLGVWLPEL